MRIQVEASRVRIYIAADSDYDLLADTDSDQVPSDGYNDGRAHITAVTVLHKRVFCPKAPIVNWRKPRKKGVGTHGPLTRFVA